MVGAPGSDTVPAPAAADAGGLIAAAEIDCAWISIRVALGALAPASHGASAAAEAAPSATTEASAMRAASGGFISLTIASGAAPPDARIVRIG